MPALSIVENDLPEELKEQLSKEYLKGTISGDVFAERVLPLLEEPQDIDHVILAWFQKFDGDILKRHNCQTRLAKLVSEGRVERIGRGRYVAIQ